MPETSLDARLERLERQNRRQRAALAGLTLVVMGLGVWLSYAQYRSTAYKQLTLEHVLLMRGADEVLTPSRFVRTSLGQPAILPQGRFQLDGGLGMTRTGASLLLLGQEASISLGHQAQGPALALVDTSGRQVLLGGGLYDGQTLLELRSADGQNALRLGLDAAGQPLFDVTRNGLREALLNPRAAEKP